MRFLSWLLGLPLLVVAVVFAVSNRHPVRAELWPFPFHLDMPLYIAVLVPLAVGLLAGVVIGWLANAPARREARRNRRRAKDLEHEVEVLRKPANDAEGRALVVSGNGAR